MYEAHWGLAESPFKSGLDPRWFYASTTHDEALARLQFLVVQRRRLGLLLGPSGVGKTVVLETFAAQVRSAGGAASVTSLIGLRPAELLWQLAAAWGTNPASSATSFALWRAVSDRLAEHRFQQLTTAVLLDDADEAAGDTLDVVVRLAQADLAPASRLLIVLAGPPDRLSQFGTRLLELADLRVDLEPWDEAEVGAYLTEVLRRAGRTAPVFDAAAIARLHQLSDGVPRRVRQLAELALAAGAGRELAQIDADTVESVYHDLGVMAVA